MINWFFIILVGVWLLVASYRDLKYREIPNWLSFSLVAFGLAYNSFKSISMMSYEPILFSVVGFFLLTLLAYALYYSRVFAGGDAKLLIALGPVLPLFSSFEMNISFIIFYVLLLLFMGGFYGLFYSFFIIAFNRKKFSKEFFSRFDKNTVFMFFLPAILFAVFILWLGELIFLFLAFVVAIFPLLLFYSKAVEECMVIDKNGKEVVVGDWLYKPVKVKGKEIKPGWEGLSEKDVKIIRKTGKKVKVKDGIPFVPSFFLSFLLLMYLRNSSWFVNYFWLFRNFF